MKKKTQYANTEFLISPKQTVARGTEVIGFFV